MSTAPLPHVEEALCSVWRWDRDGDVMKSAPAAVSASEAARLGVKATSVPQRAQTATEVSEALEFYWRGPRPSTAHPLEVNHIPTGGADARERAVLSPPLSECRGPLFLSLPPRSTALTPRATDFRRGGLRRTAAERRVRLLMEKERLGALCVKLMSLIREAAAAKKKSHSNE